MSTRHERRRFRHKASGALLTYLVDIDDPLDAYPLLQRAARYWCDGLSTPPHRECVTCGVWMSSKRYVGALLLTTPAITNPTVASVVGVCRDCWVVHDLSLAAIERRATTVLQAVVPNGRFEPQLDTRR